MSSVRVAVRARPFSSREMASSSRCCLEMRGQNTTLYNNGGDQVGRSHAKMFHFDHSYWSVEEQENNFVDQEQVFRELGWPVIEAAFAGYNSCVFAYGQTGSGKTYTMTGSTASPGLIPRICKELFNQMTKPGESEKSYRAELSYLEIYNEKVRDLLVGAVGGKHLRVREHPKDGPYVEGLSQHEVVNYTEIAALLETGNLQRATASTKMNDSSSRSHAIFTLTVTQAVLECGVPSETRSKLHLVDLAGSERASATGAEGVRLKEGGSINRSLVCLGTVISALADRATCQGKKTSYIPYRDSVLTYLLKDSLGGNAKTVMIATVSPAAMSYGETLSTLRYASRARSIVNKPVVNESSSVKVIRELKSEIERLRSIITNQHLSVDVVGKPILTTTTTGALVADLQEKEEKVAELTKEWASKWKEIQHIMKIHEVDLHSDGAKLVLQSQQPHLVGMDPDILSTGLVFLYLKGHSTTIGSPAATPPPDIAVVGPDIAEEHCQLVMEGRRVVVFPHNGNCYINNSQITTPSRLRQGDLLQLGVSAVFRFNHPQEAKRLRKRHSDGLLKNDRNIIKKKNRPKSTLDTLLPLTLHDPAVCTVELQSEAVLQAKQTYSPSTSLTSHGLEQSKRSLLSLHLEDQKKCKEWDPLLLVKMAMSPLTILSSILTSSYMARGRTPTEDIVETGELKTRHHCWWRQLLYTMFLLCHTPLLVTVVSALTWPAFSMLAILLSSVKMCSILQRCWISSWIVAPLALLTKILVTPIATVCDLTFRAGLTFIQLTSSTRTKKPI